MKQRSAIVITTSLLLAFMIGVTTALAQSAKVERIASAPEGLSHEVTAALEDKGYRVTQDDGTAAEFWMAKGMKLGTSGAAEALYPGLSNGEFVGVLRLPKGITDFRGQAVPA